MATDERIYPATESISAPQLAGIIQQMIQTEVNGRISVDTDYGQLWSLYFSAGRVIWASGGEHRWRRWYRLLKQLKIHPQSIQIDQYPGPRLEHDLLTQLFEQRRITRKSMQFAIDFAVNEVLFDIFLAASTVVQVSCDSDFRDLPESPVTVLGSYDESIARAHAMLRAWQSTELGWYSPNWSPQKTDRATEAMVRSLPVAHQRFLKLLNGKRSIRDLAIKTGKDLPTLANALSLYRRNGLLNLQILPDLRSPLATERRSSRATEPRRDGAEPAPSAAVISRSDQLLLCIDDSEHVCFIMEEILRSTGHPVLCVQAAVEAVSTVLRQRPALIFLDLVMPVVNGYELCKQIRRISTFKDVPIVILTSRDGAIDRLRAKLAGATSFLTKPIDEAAILALVQKHLSSAPTADPPQALS